MKILKLLPIILLVYALNINAQVAEFATDIVIQWKGIDVWSNDATSKKVIAFENAVYPTENMVPCYNKRYAVDNKFNYDAVITNEEFIPVTSDELQVLGADNITSSSVLVSTETLQQKGTEYLSVNVFPFIVKNGEYFRLKSFKLQINKQQTAKKAKSAINHSYVSNSVLASGKFVKIAVQNTGVYKLTYEDLNAMGVSPANVRIFGYGGEVLDQNFANPMIDDLPELAIHMEKGSDGVFGAGDYILFYAKGVQKWAYDRSREMFTHTINSYSVKGYYFVTSDAGVGKKVSSTTIQVPTDATIVPIEDFTDYTVHEKELYSLASSGKEFYGELFNENNTNTFVFNFPNIVPTNTTKVRLDVAASASVATTFTLDLDGTQAKSLQILKRTEGDNYEKGKAANGFFTFTPTRDALTLKLVYNQVVSSSIGYLNYIEVNAQRYLKMYGNAMQFQNTSQVGTSNYCQYKLSDAGGNVQIWDITDPLNIARITTQTIDGKMVFTAPGIDVKNYLAIDPTISSAYPKPEIVGTVQNQNVHAMPQAEMVILTNPLFVEQAERLAEAHRTIDNLRVNVVTTEQTYNEFSSGTPDATSYRKLVKMFYDRALSSGVSSDLPKYLLLFGRGTYDNRKLTTKSGDNLILTYQAENSLVETMSYVTDDYFGFLDNNEGTQVLSHLLDVGIGRFPVTTVLDAENVVTKTIDYMKNTTMGKWKNQLCFLADDGDNALHVRQADSIASTIARNFKSFQVTKIYLDAYNQEISASGESYPVARKQLHDLIAKGLLYLNYTGHAGAVGWTNEQVLTVNDVNGMTNKILPVWVGATCNFLQFDLKTVSAGEKVVINPNGGGIGIFSAARPVYASQNFTVNKYFAENLFKKVNGQHYRMGDVVSLAKNSVGSEINKLSYIYMGDPALKLAFPTKYTVKTESINNSTIGGDTLRAMSVVNVDGRIVDENNQTVTDFNGNVLVDVYDKSLRITTQNNHGDGSYTYSDRPNVLFSGKAEVKDGLFSFVFMLPKDIKYNYGGGRLNYYANSNDNLSEAQGNYENFIIGGTNKSVVYESDGPVIDLFLNTTNFKSGDAVNETPVLIAAISDMNGINKVGSGIGHDLLVTIDNDPGNTKIVNDFFETKANSYTEGTVNYKMSGLTEGKHTLTFKAWDLLNNSSTKTVEFEVINGLQPIIFNVYNSPNPVVTGTKIVVEHDRPETVLNTVVEIFDLAGRKIWQFDQNNADDIYWDLKGTDGVLVKTGIYFYKVSISTSNSEVISKTNKMLVIEK